MIRWTVAGLVLAVTTGCDNFNTVGQCADASTCVPVCFSDPTFVQDPTLADAGEISTAVWVAPAGGVWVGTRTRSIYRYDAGSWIQEYDGGTAPTTASGINTFWSTGEAPLFAGGFVNGGLRRSQSGAWSAESITSSAIFAISGKSDGDVWAAASESVFHYQRAAWSAVAGLPSSSTWQGVWASTTSADVWAVGAGSTQAPLAVNVGGAVPVPWQVGSSSNAQLESVWGSSSNDVWAVGADQVPTPPKALACHFDGTRWTCSPLPAGTHAYGVWGRAANDVWVSTDETILHWDGRGWSPATIFQVGGSSVSPLNLYRIWGNASPVWAATCSSTAPDHEAGKPGSAWNAPLHRESSSGGTDGRSLRPARRRATVPAGDQVAPAPATAVRQAEQA